MRRPGRPSVKLNEAYRLLPALAGLLGIFILDLMTTFRLSLKPAVSLLLVALACTGSIVAGYFLSPPGMDAFISAVNRTIDVPLLRGYTLLLMRVRAADEWLNTIQENLQHSQARFRVMADAALPLTLRHHTYSSNLLLKQGMI